MASNKRIIVTIDSRTEQTINSLQKEWKINRSAVIRYCINYCGIKVRSKKMKRINLKIKAEYAIKVFFNDKTFELRRNDKNFEVGDRINFIVIDNDHWNKLFEKKEYEITYVLKNVPEYGLDKHYCIFSIKPVVINNI